MEISDVRVRIVDTNAGDRLKAVCTVTMDDTFVVRDVKVVEGAHGPFVAMPSRKLSVPCPKCRTQNHLRAKFCNECGKQLPPARIPADDEGREKVHRDIAHPINASFRQLLQESVLDAYQEELGVEAEEDRADEDFEGDEDTEVEDAAVEEDSDDDSEEEDAEVDENQEADEYDDEDEEEEGDARGNVSDYDSIIAGLRSDRKRFVQQRDGDRGRQEKREERPAGRSRHRGREQGRDRGRSDRSDRKPAPRDSGQRRGPRPTQDARPSRDSRPTRDSAPPREARSTRREDKPMERPRNEPRPAASAPASVPVDETDETDGFAAGLLNNVTNERPKPKETPSFSAQDHGQPTDTTQNEAQPEVEQDDNDDSAFGAGLL